MAEEQPELRESQKLKPPGEIDERLKRGRKRMKDGSSKRNECWSFVENEQYVFSRDRELIIQPTTGNLSEQSGKLPWRVRSARNLIFDIVEREVALATGRVPSYDVTPSTGDPEDIGASRLSEKVALYGYDAWHIRKGTEGVVRHAIVGDGGYAWPYFDNTIGPYVDTEDGRIGMGDVRVRVFGGNEVYWEPGVPFMESRWHGIDQARDPEDVYNLDGYVGGKLVPDANRESETDRETIRDAKLVLVTEYLERPCPKYPQGRWLTLANGRVVIPERAYPCADVDGEPIDEPILHQLVYSYNPNSDRDQGLVKFLLDPQRNLNLAVSKAIEWEKLALNPQLVIRNGALAEGQRLTDEPGAVFNVWGSGDVEWRPVPQVPKELFTIKDQAEADMGRIAGQNDIPGQVEAGRAIQALIERDQSRRQTFLGNLADFHSRLMRHCLYLVAKHYTDERLLKVRGRFGPELIEDFRGGQLRGQVDVRVLAASIEPRTQQMIEQRVMNFAQMGWIKPEAAMAAINAGTAENLIDDYELAYSRVNSIIQKIKDGSFLSVPMRPVMSGEEHFIPVEQPNPETGQMETIIDPMTGQPAMQPAREVPQWMPRPFDRINVHKQQMEAWMCTTEWDSLDAPSKEAANLYYDALLKIEAKQAEQQAMVQQAMAEDMGMQNASKPQGASPLPSLPKTSGTPASNGGPDT